MKTSAVRAAERTLKAIDFKAMFRRIRDKLNARCESRRRWT